MGGNSGRDRRARRPNGSMPFRVARVQSLQSHTNERRRRVKLSCNDMDRVWTELDEENKSRYKNERAKEIEGRRLGLTRNGRRRQRPSLLSSCALSTVDGNIDCLHAHAALRLVSEAEGAERGGEKGEKKKKKGEQDASGERRRAAGGGGRLQVVAAVPDQQSDAVAQSNERLVMMLTVCTSPRARCWGACCARWVARPGSATRAHRLLCTRVARARQLAVRQTAKSRTCESANREV